MVTVIGVVLSAAWLAAVGWYVRSFVGIDNLTMMLPDEIGGFAAGAFVPLFLLWLVLGYFQHARSLRRNANALVMQTRELGRLVKQAEQQAAAIGESEQYARRDLFFRLADLLTQDLLATAQSIVTVVDGETTQDMLMKRFLAGDRNVFYSRILFHNVQGRQARFREQLAHNAGADDLLRLFCTTFESLLEECDACDDDGKMRKIYEWTPMGDVYVAFCKLTGRAPAFTERDAAQAADEAAS